MGEIDKTPSGTKTYKLTNNLAYFSRLLSQNALDRPSPKQCTSCLLMYLYRTVHRRADFYSVKDTLPACFVALHFKDSLYFQSTPDAAKRDELVRRIEASFKSQWQHFECARITGLATILEYDGAVNELDATQSDYERVEAHCRAVAPRVSDEVKLMSRRFEDWSWHESAQRICASNLVENSPLLDIVVTANESVPLSLRKQKGQRVIQSDDVDHRFGQFNV